jgi:DNA replication protein DnaC
MLNDALLRAAEALQLRGVAEALRLQFEDPRNDERAFGERLLALLDHEAATRSNQRRTRLARLAKLPAEVRIADIRWDLLRGLKRDRIEALAACDWVAAHHNIVLTGPTRVGKSFVARALASEAVAQGFTVVYKNVPTLLDELAEARALRRLPRVRGTLQRCQLLVLDMWAVQPLEPAQACDLLALLDAREERASTMVVSPVPVEGWLSRLGDPTVAEALVERVINRAHRIEMSGDAVRAVPGEP